MFSAGSIDYYGQEKIDLISSLFLPISIDILALIYQEVYTTDRPIKEDIVGVQMGMNSLTMENTIQYIFCSGDKIILGISLSQSDFNSRYTRILRGIKLESILT